MHDRIFGRHNDLSIKYEYGVVTEVALNIKCQFWLNKYFIRFNGSISIRMQVKNRVRKQHGYIPSSHMQVK